MKKQLSSMIIFGLLALSLSNASHAAPFIDTTNSWNGETGIFPFGEYNTATYGQTFKVTGVETSLDSFTFYVDDFVNPDYVDFQAFVYAWDGNKAFGSQLYGSSAISTTNNNSNDGFEVISIHTGGLNLINGSEYIAFFSASNQFDGVTGTGKLGGLDGNPYADGKFVYMDNGSHFDALFNPGWTTYDNSVDLAFTMNFTNPSSSPVPEPGTIFLLGSGIVALAGCKLRSRKTD